MQKFFFCPWLNLSVSFRQYFADIKLEEQALKWAEIKWWDESGRKKIEIHKETKWRKKEWMKEFVYFNPLVIVSRKSAVKRKHNKVEESQGFE